MSADAAQPLKLLDRVRAATRSPAALPLFVVEGFLCQKMERISSNSDLCVSSAQLYRGRCSLRCTKRISSLPLSSGSFKPDFIDLPEQDNVLPQDLQLIALVELVHGSKGP